jgi:hypothetical protein
VDGEVRTEYGATVPSTVLTVQDLRSSEILTGLPSTIHRRFSLVLSSLLLLPYPRSCPRLTYYWYGATSQTINCSTGTVLRARRSTVQLYSTRHTHGRTASCAGASSRTGEKHRVKSTTNSPTLPGCGFTPCRATGRLDGLGEPGSAFSVEQWARCAWHHALLAGAGWLDGRSTGSVLIRQTRHQCAIRFVQGKDSAGVQTPTVFTGGTYLVQMAPVAFSCQTILLLGNTYCTEYW